MEWSLAPSALAAPVQTATKRSRHSPPRLSRLEVRHAERRRQRSDHAHRPRHTCGRAVPTLLAARVLPSELPRPDSDTVRITLLGEALIAFRDTTGQVGIIAAN